MPYMVVEDFSLGMDLRKSPVTASGKSLRKLTNAFVNAGGEIEKRKGFLNNAVDLTGTYGLGSLGTTLWVFGSTTRPATLPGWISYLQLVGANIAQIVDVDVFDNQFYVVVRQPDGNFAHYYNGAHVTEAPNAGQALAHRSKMYAVANNIVYFSDVYQPTKWTPGTGAPGAGFIQLDGQDEGAVYLIGLAPYYDQLALFGRNSVQIWAMDVDPAQNQLVQTLGATGLLAPKALSRFATGDVLFLNDSGVRSLKARDSSNAAGVSDIGSPMDEDLRALIAAARRAPGGGNPVPDALARAVATVEPTTGQFWLCINADIYVLSLAPSAHVSAWSKFFTGFNVEYVCEVGERLYLRNNAVLFSYGAVDEIYDNSEVEVVTPMIAGAEPATDKQFYGIDAALEGTWSIEVGTDPAAPDTRELVATVGGPTFGLQNLGLQNSGTHISARLRCSDTARARIGNLMFHYNKGSTD